MLDTQNLVLYFVALKCFQLTHNLKKTPHFHCMEVCFQLQMRSSGWSVQLSEREFDVGHLLQFVHSFEIQLEVQGPRLSIVFQMSNLMISMRSDPHST